MSKKGLATVTRRMTWTHHSSFGKPCDVKNSYKSLGFNNRCHSPVFMQKAAATVVWSHQCFQNVAQDWGTEQLTCVISASCVTSGASSPGTNLWQLHSACSFSQNAPWFMTFPSLSLWKSVFYCMCYSTAWLKEKWSSKLNVSYTDFSKSNTKACKFHLAIFVCLNSPCAFFPLITLCWLESDLTHKDICWQGQDKMAEFLSPRVTEPSTKAYDCYLTKDP